MFFVQVVRGRPGGRSSSLEEMGDGKLIIISMTVSGNNR